MEQGSVDSSGKGEQVFFEWNAQNEHFEHGFISIGPTWQVTYLNKAARRLFSQVNSQGTTSFWDLFREIIPQEFIDSHRNSKIGDMPDLLSGYWKDLNNSYQSFAFYINEELSFHIRKLKAWQPSGSRILIVQQLFHFISEISSECLWDWDLKTKEVFWVDGGHHKILGYNIENTWLPESFWINRIHPNDRKRVTNKLRSLFSSSANEFWDCTYRLKTADGDYLHVHDRGHIFFDSNKVPIRIFGATQNESDKVNAENKLEDTQKQLSLIVEQTVNAILITATDGTINYVNKAFTKCTGFEAAEVYGKKPGAVLQGAETSAETVEYIRIQIKKRLPFDCEILNYSKTGKRLWIHLQGQPFDEGKENNERYFCVQTDITEKVLSNNKAIAENERHKIAITKAVLTALENERDEIGKEIHDNLNHTLVASKLYLELAKSDDTNRSVYLDKSLGYINSVIENIRRISKKLVTPELMGLNSSIESLLDDLALVYPIKFVLSTQISETHLSEAIKLNIFRIIQEQLTNIIKHSKATKSTIRLMRLGSTVTLTITDNGIGFDASREVTGVGLRNIRSRAALFAGKVEIKSTPGNGFQLKVLLHTDA